MTNTEDFSKLPGRQLTYYHQHSAVGLFSKLPGRQLTASSLIAQNFSISKLPGRQLSIDADTAHVDRFF